MMRHAALVTFDVSDDGQTVQINITCPTCGPVAPLVVSTIHLGNIAVALVAASELLKIDLSTPADVLARQYPQPQEPREAAGPRDDTDTTQGPEDPEGTRQPPSEGEG